MKKIRSFGDLLMRLFDQTMMWLLVLVCIISNTVLQDNGLGAVVYVISFPVLIGFYLVVCRLIHKAFKDQKKWQHAICWAAAFALPIISCCKGEIHSLLG